MTIWRTRRQHNVGIFFRGELDSAIDSYVPMKKQGKRSKKKHLSKEAFGKIRLDINKICGGFINIRERIKIRMLTNRH